MRGDISGSIDKAVDVLVRGGVIVYPTETVYGIGCDPLDAAACDRIRRLKGRDGEKPMLLLAASLDQVTEFAGLLSETALALAGAFWPGPLTMVIMPEKHLPVHIRGQGGGVAFRVSPCRVASEIARRFGMPVTSTSANRSGEQPAVTHEDAITLFGGAVDCVVEPDEPLGGIPSTVVDVTGESVRLLREGGVSFERIREII